MTALFLGTERLTLSDADLLGEGGEARVFRWRDLALKVFHPTSVAGKEAKVRAFPAGLPAEVVGPLERLVDTKQRFAGYAMRRVEKAEEFGRLQQRKYREATVPTQQVMRLFGTLEATLRALHAKQVVVGDLNDGNVLFSGDQVRLIDADSMQFAGLGCSVAHERYLDPTLYGVDLTQRPAFSERTDWYAFAVLLFASLTYTHPFGGTHRTLGTLLRRAEAKHSVFQSDVVLPRSALKLAALPDDALHWFRGVFERGERTPPPFAVSSLRFGRCGCGFEHARAVCPECHALGHLVTLPIVKRSGRCSARTIVATSGVVVAAGQHGGVRYALVDGGALKREDGQVVPCSPLGAHSRVFVAGATTWVAHGSGAVERLERGQLVERLTTAVRGVEPAFCAAPGVAYRQEGDWLIDAVTGARVGTILEGQTWLATGEALGVGFYRAAGRTRAFLVRTGKPGLKQLDDVDWRGRWVDAHAAFDAEHALLTVVVEDGGKDLVHRWLIGAQGVVLARSVSDLRGRAALMRGRVVVGSDGGLVALKADSGHLLEAAQFPDTQAFVDAGDELLPQPDGSLVVVGPRDIVQLTLT